MRSRTLLLLTVFATMAGCHQSSEVGTNIADAHDNAADALDNKADALHAQAKQTRQWGGDLKKEADKIAKDGGHPDQTALNQM